MIPETYMTAPLPDEIIYYGCGMFGPLMFHFLPENTPEGTYHQIANENGFKLATEHFLFQHNEDSDPLYKMYDSGDIDKVLEKWEPLEENNKEWKVVGMHDTEDGPVALLIKEISNA